MKNKKELIIGLILAVCLLLSGYNFIKTYDYEEVCLAQYCTEWATGEEWIKDNCNLNSDNKYEYCDVKVEGQDYKVALENINLTQARSCKNSICISNVLVKQTEVNNEK